MSDYASLPGQSLLKETLGHQNRQSSAVIGATTDFDSSLTQFLPWNARGECLTLKPPQLLRRANQSTFFMVTPDTPEEVAAELADLDEVEALVAPHGRELINLYFRIVHPSFPIIHKKVFLEKYGRSYHELTPTGLGAVYIMALNWWSYSSVLSGLPKPDSKQLEKKVLRMLFDVHKRPKISDLQGGLVLMQCPSVTSWAMTGHLVAMAQNLGINADCSDWRVPDWERGVRKRAAWALFMQDKWGALVYGRGSHIRPDDWDVKPLTTSDFPETAIDDDDEEGSAEIEKGKQTFIQMVLLSEIVSQILDQFFTLKATSRQQTLQEVLERAKPLQLNLRSWYSNVPAALSIDSTVPRKLSSVGYLHLAYFTAEITLHRAILRTHTLPNPDLDLLHVTRTAAATRFTSALDFVKRLKAEHLQSFWYFSSALSLSIIGIFAGILCRASEISDTPEEHYTYLNQLAEYRWILRISAKSAEFIETAVGLLDARNQILEQPQPQQPGVDDQSMMRQEEDDEDALSTMEEHTSSLPRAADGETWSQSYEFDSSYYNFDWEGLGSTYQGDFDVG